MMAAGCCNDARAPDALYDGPFFPNGRQSQVDGMDPLPELDNPRRR